MRDNYGWNMRQIRIMAVKLVILIVGQISSCHCRRRLVDKPETLNSMECNNVAHNIWKAWNSTIQMFIEKKYLSHNFLSVVIIKGQIMQYA